MRNNVKRRKHALRHIPNNTLDQTRDLSTVIERYRPRIPTALADGLLPVAAWQPELIVVVPVIDEPGYISEAGDFFSCIVDGILLDETRVTLANEDATEVTLRIPSRVIDDLTDGLHAISFCSVPMPFGDVVYSGATTIRLRRKPVGGRLLPPILFARDCQDHGVPLSSTLSGNAAALIGMIPDYADIDPRDTVHLFLKPQDTGVEVYAGSAPVATDGSPITVRFDLSSLGGSTAPVTVEFYYFVIDAVGLKSPTAPSAVLTVV